MVRYVNGLRCEGEVVPDRWVIRTWECNGVMERSAVPLVAWEVTHNYGWKPTGWEPTPDWSHMLPGTRRETEAEIAKREAQEAEEAEERKQESLKRSASRSKTTCRRAIVMERFDQLMTLTYRDNQEDRELCKRHFKEWVRRMKRALGGVFRYVAAFERQERGSMHVHLATHKLPQHVSLKGTRIKSYELGTRIWRSIVGEGNGMCFLGGKRRGKWAAKWSLAKMAAYVSKYIMKDYQDVPEGVNRFSRSVGAPIAKVTTVEVECSFADLVGLVYEYRDGDSVLALRVGGWSKDRLWFCKESGVSS